MSYQGQENSQPKHKKKKKTNKKIAMHHQIKINPLNLKRSFPRQTIINVKNQRKRKSKKQQ